MDFLWPWSSFGAEYSMCIIFINYLPKNRVSFIQMFPLAYICPYFIFMVIQIFYITIFIFFSGKSLLETVLRSVPFICSGCMIAILIPQVYWWILMMNGLRKFVSRRYTVKKEWIFFILECPCLCDIYVLYEIPKIRIFYPYKFSNTLGSDF